MLNTVHNTGIYYKYFLSPSITIIKMVPPKSSETTRSLIDIAITYVPCVRVSLYNSFVLEIMIERETINVKQNLANFCFDAQKHCFNSVLKYMLFGLSLYIDFNKKMFAIELIFIPFVSSHTCISLILFMNLFAFYSSSF